MTYHPDKQGPDVSVTKAEEHLHRFIEVNQAWKILSNKETNSKRGFDLQLRAGELNQSWPVDARVSLDDMTYDDDNEVYDYGCCCGGQFSIGKEAGDEKAIVRCDTCSLSIRIVVTILEVKESCSSVAFGVNGSCNLNPLSKSCVTVLLAPPQGDPRVWETGPSIPSPSGSISIGHNIDPPSPQMTIRE
ncbi:dnaJ homolog subfamily C member 24-like [Oncorhynchus kisutch]|uniref:dnaJ homolog subfamily C member 24-like n=1 Tax=Oncorhynchus kisutch TaxID=8019 RepID=UPI0012DFC6B4|nr:dnaJ homolog subfamily C member 24-like [Oncorhynchus kisutch]